MRTTIKGKLFGLAFLAAVSSTFVALPMMAQAEVGSGDLARGSRCEYQQGGRVQGEYMQKHQQKLHDALKLTGDQESAWKNFTQQAKPGEQRAKFDREKFDREEFAKLTTPERLDHLLARSKERQSGFESHVQAVKTFYNVLSPEQRKIFDDNFRAHRGHAGWDAKGRPHHGAWGADKGQYCHEKPERMEKN